MRPIAITIPHRELVIAPAACLHWPIGERDLMGDWIEFIRSRPNAYTVLLGDSMDFARTHYRRHLKSYVDDENSQESIDEYVREETRKLAKALSPIKGRIWGVIRGNHYHEFLDGTNTEQYLCQVLGLRYLGVLGMIRLIMPGEGRGGTGAGHTSRAIKVFCHHSGGTNAARTTGGDVNSAMKNELAWDADVYLCAHTHRRIAWKETLLTITDRGEPKVVERTKVFARAGSYLKGFKEDNPTTDHAHRPSYAEEAAYRATDLGWIEIEVGWRRRGHAGKDGAYPDFKVRY